MTTAVILALEANKDHPSCCLGNDKGSLQLLVSSGSDVPKQGRRGFGLTSSSLCYGVCRQCDTYEAGITGSQIGIIHFGGMPLGQGPTGHWTFTVEKGL